MPKRNIVFDVYDPLSNLQLFNIFGFILKKVTIHFDILFTFALSYTSVCKTNFLFLGFKKNVSPLTSITLQAIKSYAYLWLIFYLLF